MTQVNITAVSQALDAAIENGAFDHTSQKAQALLSQINDLLYTQAGEEMKKEATKEDASYKAMKSWYN